MILKSWDILNTQKKPPQEWSEVHKIGFKRLIEKITNAPQLKYYEQNETGLSATLTENLQPLEAERELPQKGDAPR